MLETGIELLGGWGNQNAKERTVASAWSVRPTPDAPVLLLPPETADLPDRRLVRD
jgi:DNA primase